MTMKLVSSVAIVLGVGSLLTACAQPAAGCIVQDSASWIAKYDLKPGQNISDSCQALVAPPGERIGVFKFKDPDVDNSSLLTLRPEGIANRNSRHVVPPDAEQQDPRLHAIGSLAETPDDDSFCASPKLEVAVDAASSATEDATKISYNFTDVKVYSDPRAPGTQFKANLTYTRDGCTTEYTVRAMWPASACDPDLFANEAEWTADNAADRCAQGSLINPDFAVTCDPVLKRCVPAKDIPSFK